MIRNNLFVLFVIIAAIGLLVVSLSTVNKREAITAVVESQKTAISYRKAVTIEKIYVNAGQKVKKGDLLLEVTRPDLLLDSERIVNKKEKIQAGIKRLQSSYESKNELLNIEQSSKMQRLDAKIEETMADLAVKASLRRNMSSLSDSAKVSFNTQDPDSIILQSYIREKDQLATYYRSERRRQKIMLNENLAEQNLELELLENEMKVLLDEEKELKKYAPFDGTIATVNAQLREIVPPYETILSIFEPRPSMIKAFVSNTSVYHLNVGTTILVESSSRPYETQGTIIEIGARIVSYRDPASPPEMPDLYGREVFIKLPSDNEFLYGEQVYVYPMENKD